MDFKNSTGKLPAKALSFLFCSRKGGTGKSTTIIQMAVYAATVLGWRVAVIDGDGQGSTYNFFSSRDEENLERREKGLPELPYIKYESHAPDSNISEALRDLRSNYDLVLVDTRGGPSKAMVSSIASVTSVIVVTGTSGIELEQLGAVIKLVRDTEAHINDSLPPEYGEFSCDLKILPTRCEMHTKAYKTFIDSVGQLDQYATVMSTKIKNVQRVRDTDLYNRGIAIPDKEVKAPKACFQLALDELIKPQSSVTE